MEGNFNMDLSKIANGGLQEKANRAFAKVFENLSDPNTPYKNKRSIEMKLVFEQNEDRNDISCSIQVNTKLAPAQAVSTQFELFKDLRDGSLQVEEYGSQLRGQTQLPKNPENNVVAIRKAN